MSTWTLLLIGVTAVVVIGLLIAWGVRFLERKRQLDQDATDLQYRIAEPIARDPELHHCAVLPTATLREDGSQTVVITGQIESERARDRVLAIARSVAPRAAIVDRLEVLPADHRRAG